MKIAERLEANALIDALTEDGEWFDPEKARRLIEIVPVSARPPLFSFGIKGNHRKSGMEGNAAGVGNVQMPDGESEDFEWSSDKTPLWRAGAYKLNHEPGELEINQLFTDTMEDDGTGRRALLRYSKTTGEPRELQLYMPAIYRLGPAQVTIPKWQGWKLPRP